MTTKDFNIFDELVSTVMDSSETASKNCFHQFCCEKDDVIKIEHLRLILIKLFADFDNNKSEMKGKIKEIFEIFDKNHDGCIDYREFEDLWKYFILPIVKPKFGLIIVNVQNDFIDGAVALRDRPAGHDSASIISVINTLLGYFPSSAAFYTLDWHPEDDICFIDNIHLHKFHKTSPVSQSEAKVFDTVIFEGPPLRKQTLFPRHCLKGTWGFELHRDVKIAKERFLVCEGEFPDRDFLSDIWKNKMINKVEMCLEMKARDITQVLICGISIDYYVGWIAEYISNYGFKAIVVEDACGKVEDNKVISVKEKLISRGITLTSANEIPLMLDNFDRKWELGSYTLEQIKLKNYCGTYYF